VITNAMKIKALPFERRVGLLVYAAASCSAMAKHLDLDPTKSVTAPFISLVLCCRNPRFFMH
jgi:hypothetical protein